MKTKSYIKTGLFAVAAMASATIYYSCSKEDAQQPQTEEFSKTIEVFDDCGLNSVVLKLTSDDKSVVDMYSADNFQLIINPVPYDEPETDAEVEEDDNDEGTYSDGDVVKIGMCVLEENFVEEVTSYDIEKTQPDAYKDLRAKWTKDYIFSTKGGVAVTRTSINRRVYLTTKSGNKNSGTSNSDIEYGWYDGEYNGKLLSNKQTGKDWTCNRYYIGAIIKAKKHEGKYTYSFFVPTQQCNK